jgi:hypothetical protein
MHGCSRTCPTTADLRAAGLLEAFIGRPVTEPSGAFRMLYALNRFEHVTEQKRRDLAKFWTRSRLPQNSHVSRGGSFCAGGSGVTTIGAITIGVSVNTCFNIQYEKFITSDLSSVVHTLR